MASISPGLIVFPTFAPQIFQELRRPGHNCWHTASIVHAGFALMNLAPLVPREPPDGNNLHSVYQGYRPDIIHHPYYVTISFVPSSALISTCSTVGQHVISQVHLVVFHVAEISICMPMLWLGQGNFAHFVNISGTTNLL